MNPHPDPPFVPGLVLAEILYREAVRPLLDRHFPSLPYSAALLGPGSEVLGFDDAQSTDHHWGPRLMLFLRDEDAAQFGAVVWEYLAHNLPYRLRGYSTHFSPPDPNDSNVQHRRAIESGPVNHRVEILTLRRFLADYLAIDSERPLDAADWLTLPAQKLRTLVAGAVYHDDVGLAALRQRLAYYPHDIWLYLLAAGWQRIGQEEHLMGRAGQVGDEIGAALIGAQLVRDIMRLCFLLERVYAPYPKWFGAAFQQLACAPTLTPHLQAALAATHWAQREAYLTPAYEHVAAMHNALGVTEPLPTAVCNFFGRPFRVIALHGFSSALLAQIADPEVRRIAARPLIGSLDLFSDNTDLLSSPQWRAALRRLYTDVD